MQRVPVGIDLGTTYSCISHLDRQGEPHTLPNPDGELCTPSAVLIEGGEVIVGTEALRNSVSHSDRVVQHSKRYLGDPRKAWVIDGVTYRPPDISAFILRYLLRGAEQHLGPIEHAVITVPAQFSDGQRQQTADAGLQAGLKKVDIINEPVAAALCYVLGEGLWFAELADDQIVMVYDLGGGTFDLSLVQYNRDEVRVKASSGDLNLGGIDWNKRLEEFACEQFLREIPQDPRIDCESMQALALEVEQTKRSLSVRSRASLCVQHAGRRKVFGIDQATFESISKDLVDRTERITRQLLKDNRMGWAHIDAVLVTGGASRMPMIRSMLQRISGTTLNQTLSPEQSISHGAAYYAGMLASGHQFTRKSFLSRDATARLAKFKQHSVSARALGILVKDRQTGERKPHFLIPANTPLPCAFRQSFGTVVENQRRVHLHIVEGGTIAQEAPVKLGACIVDDLPPGLPEGTPIEVTIRYDEQARVHVSAMELRSRRSARTSIIREENLLTIPGEAVPGDEARLMPPSPVTSPQSGSAGRSAPAQAAQRAGASPPVAAAAATPLAGRKTFVPAPQNRASAGTAAAAPRSPRPAKIGPRPVPPASLLDSTDRPIPLCNACGEPLTPKGECIVCGTTTTGSKATRGAAAKKPATPRAAGHKRPARPASTRPVAPPLDEDEVIELEPQQVQPERRGSPPGRPPVSGKRPG